MDRNNPTRLQAMNSRLGSQRQSPSSRDPFSVKQLGQLEVNVPRSVSKPLTPAPLRPLQTNLENRNDGSRRPVQANKNLQPIDKVVKNLAKGKQLDPVQQKQLKPPAKDEYKLVEDKDVPVILKDYRNKKRYRKHELLGQGAFGKVYHVQLMEKDGPHYAVKILAKASLAPENIKRKLFAEINIHRVLKHDYIVQFDSVFEDRNNVYMLMEMCHNKTLSWMVKGRKYLLEDEARYYMGQILSALRYMSDNRILHRDLKLGNVLLDKNMDCKIGDFGLAALLLNNSERKRTICGTPHYIAPEILFNKGEGHNYRVDMWSAGILLFNLLYGRHPFHRDEPTELYQRVRRNEYSTRNIFPNVPYDVSDDAKDLIKKLLVNDPDARLTVIEALEHPFFTKYAIPDRIPVEARFRKPELYEMFDNPIPDAQSSKSKVAAAIRLHSDRNESYIDYRINPPLQIMQEVILDPRSQYPLEVESSQQSQSLKHLQSSQNSQRSKSLRIPVKFTSESSSKKRSSSKEVDKVNKRVCSDNDTKVSKVGEVFEEEVVEQLIFEDIVEEQIIEEQVTEEQITNKKIIEVEVAEEEIIEEKIVEEKNSGSLELPKVETLKVDSDPPIDSRPFAMPLPLPNRKPIMVEMADNLNIMIERVGAIPKEKRDEITEDDPKFKWTEDNIFVSNWIDCTSRYGFSYRLSDGTLGLLYNDGSTITTVDNLKFYYIYTRLEDSRYIEALYEKDKDLPPDLSKKCTILDQFKNYIIGSLPIDNHVKQATEPTKIHVFKYIVANEGLAFRLNNGVIQFNFFRRDKLVLYDKGRKLIYIDKSRNIFRHNSLDVLASTRQDAIEALHLAYSILKGQNEQRQDALRSMRWDRMKQQYNVESLNSPSSSPPSP